MNDKATWTFNHRIIVQASVGLFNKLLALLHWLVDPENICLGCCLLAPVPNIAFTSASRSSFKESSSKETLPETERGQSIVWLFQTFFLFESEKNRIKKLTNFVVSFCEKKENFKTMKKEKLSEIKELSTSSIGQSLAQIWHNFLLLLLLLCFDWSVRFDFSIFFWVTSKMQNFLNFVFFPLVVGSSLHHWEWTLKQWWMGKRGNRQIVVIWPISASQQWWRQRWKQTNQTKPSPNELLLPSGKACNHRAHSNFDDDDDDEDEKSREREGEST